MAKSNSQKQASRPSSEQRRMRRNQIIFAGMSIIVILSWIIALVAK